MDVIKCFQVGEMILCRTIVFKSKNRMLLFRFAVRVIHTGSALYVQPVMYAHTSTFFG